MNIIEIPKVKKHVLPVRFDETMFKQIKALAKKYKTSQSVVVRALVEQGLTSRK